jgi:hypothetical protein
MGARDSTGLSRGRQIAWALSTTFIAVVWGVNGLWCKVLGQVPRHEAIVGRVVGRVVGDDVGAVAPVLTVLIGFSELFMLAWFMSGRFARLCAASQVAIVMTMNVIEQLVAPDLLLFGPWNFVNAVAFSAVVVVRQHLHNERSR